MNSYLMQTFKSSEKKVIFSIKILEKWSKKDRIWFFDFE